MTQVCELAETTLDERIANLRLRASGGLPPEVRSPSDLQ